MIFGAHLSYSGITLCNLVENIKIYNLNAIQVFLGSPHSSNIKEIDIKEIKEYLKLKTDIKIFIHSAYINSLTKYDAVKHYSNKKIISELKLAYYLDSGVIIHPGSLNINKNKITLEEGIDNIAKSINFIYSKYTDLGELLLENSSREGSKIPNTLEELYLILDKLQDKNYYNKIGICLDTCHMFAAGEYDLGKINETDRLYNDLKKFKLLKKVKLFHLNDSKDKFGSKKDRHQDIGYGHIWKDNLKSLKYFLNKFNNYTFIFENDKTGKIENSVDNVLKSLNL